MTYGGLLLLLKSTDSKQREEANNSNVQQFSSAKFILYFGWVSTWLENAQTISLGKSLKFSFPSSLDESIDRGLVWVCIHKKTPLGLKRSWHWYPAADLSAGYIHQACTPTQRNWNERTTHLKHSVGHQEFGKRANTQADAILSPYSRSPQSCKPLQT